MTTSHEVSKMLRAHSAASLREDSESYAVSDIAWALQERDSKGVDSDTKDGHLIIAPMVATPILEAGARTGRVGHEDRDGLGIGEPNDPMFTLQGSKQHAIAFSSKDHGADAGEIAPTLRGMGHDASHANGGGQVAVAFDTTQITSKDNRCNPQIGDACHPLASGAHPPAIAFKPSTRSAIRRLTPRECERLQGFPDDYTLVSYRGKPAADGPRYKALGNSMAVPCIRWILMRIEAVDRQQQTVA
jgi:site-specific DNA-cytosine methylase